MNKSIILLSGGLDSVVSLALNKEKDNIKLALFFNYGQKACESEKLSVQKLSDYYGIELEEIKLNWLQKITKTSLVSDNNIPDVNDLNDDNETNETMKKVWIPNRNGLFLNIAGCYADSYGYNKILIGANKEEAATFTDNSNEFICATTKELEFSTLVKPQITAPLINLNKNDIVKLAFENKVPFELLWSCYKSDKKHCGKCESCRRLKRALENNGLVDIINLLF